MSRVLHSQPAAPSGRSELSELAETVAHVTFAMHEALATYDESALPGGYRYHLFGGFPGFCDYAAEAGLALHCDLASSEPEDRLDLIQRYAQRVMAHAFAFS